MKKTTLGFRVWKRGLMIVGSVLLVAACASKKPGTDSLKGGVGETEPNPSVKATEETYSATGSDSGSIAGLSTIYFDLDQSALTSQARKMLGENADWIKKNNNVTIQIEGHCDSRGTVEYNLALGDRRAQAVKNYLASLGIDGKRLSIISYGKEKPVAQGDTEEAYSKNRRANFVPLPK